MAQNQKEEWVEAGQHKLANPIHDPFIRYNLHNHHKNLSVIM